MISWEAGFNGEDKDKNHKHNEIEDTVYKEHKKQSWRAPTYDECSQWDIDYCM